MVVEMNREREREVSREDVYVCLRERGRKSEREREKDSEGERESHIDRMYKPKIFYTVMTMRMQNLTKKTT